MDNRMLVENIKRISKEKGYTISQIERQLGWSAGLISRWKTTSPAVDKISDLAELLDVSLDELVGVHKTAGLIDRKITGKSICEKLLALTYDCRVDWREAEQSQPFGEKLGEREEGYSWSKSYFCKLGPGYFVITLWNDDNWESGSPSGLELLVFSNGAVQPCTVRGEEALLAKLLERVDQKAFAKWSETENEAYLLRVLEGQYDSER